MFTNRCSCSMIDREEYLTADNLFDLHMCIGRFARKTLFSIVATPISTICFLDYE